jgi:hypothetical protein
MELVGKVLLYRGIEPICRVSQGRLAPVSQAVRYSEGLTHLSH